MAIIYTYPVKTNPIVDDMIVISDSEDNNKTKQIKISSLPGAEGEGILKINNSTAQSQTLSTQENTPLSFLTSEATGNHNLVWSGALSPLLGGTGLDSVGNIHQVLTVNNTESNDLRWRDQRITKIVKVTGPREGVVLNIGDPVSILSSSTGNVPTVQKMTNTSDGNGIFGISAEKIEDISEDTEFTVVIEGELNNVNTTAIIGDGNPGNILYVGDSTPLTTTVPVGQNKNIIPVGHIIRKSQSAGKIMVDIGYKSYMPNSKGKGYIWVGTENYGSDQLEPGSNGFVLTADDSEELGVKWVQGGQSGLSSISFAETGLTPEDATGGSVVVGGTLNETNGGTGNSSYTKGDILYCDSSNDLKRLEISQTNGDVLMVDGGIPAWKASSNSLTGEDPIEIDNGKVKLNVISLKNLQDGDVFQGFSTVYFNANLNNGSFGVPAGNVITPLGACDKTIRAFVNENSQDVMHFYEFRATANQAVYGTSTAISVYTSLPPKVIIAALYEGSLGNARKVSEGSEDFSSEGFYHTVKLRPPNTGKVEIKQGQLYVLGIFIEPNAESIAAPAATLPSFTEGGGQGFIGISAPLTGDKAPNTVPTGDIEQLKSQINLSILSINK